MTGNVPKYKILVSVLDNAKQTSSGIFIPNTNKKQKKAEVVLCGEGVEEVKQGDSVFYLAEGIELEIDNNKYILLNERDVCYIL